MFKVAVMLGAAAVLALASCGDGDDSDSGSTTAGSGTSTTSGPTKRISRKAGRKVRRARAKTVAKVNQVCRRAGVQIGAATINVGDPPRQVRARAKRLARSYENLAEGLAGLEAQTSQSRQDVGSGVRRAVLALEDAVLALTLIEGAAQGGDLSTAGPQIERLSANIRRYQATVRKYKFSGCY